MARVRVVSYNVLSSSLSRASYFRHCHPEAVTKPQNRWNLVKEFLDAEVARNSVICLQEVSQSWRGKLEVYFAKHNYAYEGQQYGSKFNGRMGVGIAFSMEDFELEEVGLLTVSDCKSNGYKPPRATTDKVKYVPGRFDATAKAFKRVSASWKELFGALYHDLFVGPDTPVDNDDAPKAWDEFPLDRVWAEVERRWNVLVCVRLLLKNSADDAATLTVGTYHMPCAFWAPHVMVAHASMAANALLSFSPPQSPVVFAGDFNFKPCDSMYALMVEGTLPKDHPEHPPLCFDGDSWSVDLPRKFKSAYKELDGKEPEFTNRARCGDAEETFSETLDYVFFADGQKHKQTPTRLECVGTLDLARRIRAARKLDSLPSEHEGSDHLPVGAEFELTRA